MLDSFIFAFNSVAPIIMTVAVGYVLKRMGFIDGDFVKMANKLVFRVFLPAMLFLNIYGIEDLGSMSFGYAIYAVIAVIVVFFIMIPISMATTKDPAARGALLQSSFRSNYALIGIPLATTLFPGEGAAAATLLSALSIPAFNTLAVISLSIFKPGKGKGKLKSVLLGIVKNPLILSIFAGLFVLGIRALLVKFDIGFRLSQIPAIFGTLKYLSNLATPLALIVLGAQFEFSAISSMKREITVGTLVRTVLVPALGLGIAYLAFRNDFDGAQFASLVAVFATPVAVSSVPMAQEMGADSELAGQLVVWTTLVSALSVFLSSFLLSLAGIF